MPPKQSIDELEALVNAQTEELRQLRGDLGVTMEMVNKLVGRLSPHPAKATSGSPGPPTPPPPTTDATQLLQLMIQAEERGSRRTMDMFDRVGQIMGNLQKSFVEGMREGDALRAKHLEDYRAIVEELEPDDEPESGGLGDIGEAMKLADEIRARWKQGGGNGAAGAPAPSPPTPPIINPGGDS